MSSLEQALQGILDSVAQDWTDAEKALVESVAMDYATLIQERISGHDISAEMEQVRAQASGIMAGAAGSVAEALEDGVKRFLSDLVRELIPGL